MIADVAEDLELLIRSRYALIVLETHEEERADPVLRHVATKLSIPLLCWSRSRGLRRGTSPLEPAIVAALYSAFAGRRCVLRAGAACCR